MNDMKEKAIGAVKAFLERKGYEIVDESWRGPEGIGGIDLVEVDEDGTLVFVDATVRIGTDGFPEAHRARWRRRGSSATATTTPTPRSASARWSRSPRRRPRPRAPGAGLPP